MGIKIMRFDNKYYQINKNLIIMRFDKDKN